jgi:hypothetical protein
MIRGPVHAVHQCHTAPGQARRTGPCGGTNNNDVMIDLYTPFWRISNSSLWQCCNSMYRALRIDLTHKTCICVSACLSHSVAWRIPSCNM